MTHLLPSRFSALRLATIANTLPTALSTALSTALLSGSLLVGSTLLAPASLAQRITDINPGVNSSNVVSETSISGLFDTSDGSAIDLASVKIILDGTNVTAASSITPNFFSYKPATPLAPGPHTVQIEYKNTVGLQRVASWSFTVQNPQPALNITGITHNATTALGPGSTLLATLNGTPGAQASIILIEGWQGVREIQAQEVEPGVYVATFVMPQNLTPQEAVIMGQLQKGQQKIYGAARQPITLSATATTDPTITQTPNTTPPATPPAQAPASTPTIPLQPQFTSHQTGDRITSQGFSLTGQTRPNVKVRVKVTSITPVLGGFVNVGGTTLVDREFTADGSGVFSVQVPAPLVLNSNTRYEIQAVAVEGGTTSPVTELRLQQR